MASNVATIKPSNYKPQQGVALASTIGMANNSVAKPSITYEQGAKRRALPRTLMGGTDAMRLARDQYLPKHPVESGEAYDSRLANAFLYNAYEMTVNAQASKFFGEPVGLKDDVPPALQALCENIDGEGRALTPFAIDVTKEAFVDGISFILVDFPSMGMGRTMADQKLAGARPYWILVKAEDVIGWRATDIAGKSTLQLVRIKEDTTVSDGEYGEKPVERVRELRPGSWRLWEKKRDLVKAEDNWVVVDEGTTSLTYIPLFPFYVNSVGFFDGSPPLRALAEMNQEHWISLSEQKRALSFARFDMLVFAGVDTETTGVTVGPNKVWMLPSGATASTITQGGKGIEAGRIDLQDTEQRMRTAGLELRVENAGTTTATAAAIDSDESNAGLRAVAKNLEDVLESALQASADYLRLPKGGTVEISDEFGGNEIPGTPLDITTMNTSGIISKQTTWVELKRRNVLGEDFDATKEQILLDEESAQGLQHALEQQQAFSSFQQQDPNQPPPDGGQPPQGNQGA